MFRKITLLVGLVGIMLSLNPAFGSIIYVSGDVSGTWSADTVIVEDEVRVPLSMSLTILPGVEVLFQVYCKFIVDSNATLLAVGTAVDSIRFDELTLGTHWRGIRFLSASSSSKLEFCHLTNGSAGGIDVDNDGGAIYCYLSSLTIQNSLFDSCYALRYGGAICCDNSSNAAISGNTIRGNLAMEDGGGILCANNSNPTISGNSISGNSSYWDGGGGICCRQSSPSISNNSISGNSASEGGGVCCYYYANPIISGNSISGNSSSAGGGIYCDTSSPTISSNTIIDNWGGDGGGICCGTDSGLIEFNEISGNTAFYNGGGIYFTSSNVTMNKNTIAYNNAPTGAGIYSAGSSLVLVNSIFWGNAPDQIYEYSSSNVQTTYSDIQGGWLGTGNINEDPLFANAAGGNYLLQAGSPCINAGDPDPIYNDPNGTRADMGCYYYGFVGVSEAESPELPKEFALLPCFPNPFNASTVASYELRAASCVNLKVYDTAGRLVETLVNGWRPAGRHEVTFDGSGMASGVYIARLRAGNYVGVEKMVLLK